MRMRAEININTAATTARAAVIENYSMMFDLSDLSNAMTDNIAFNWGRGGFFLKYHSSNLVCLKCSYPHNMWPGHVQNASG